MYLAGRSHIIQDRSLIDTMRMFHAMGYGGLELSLQHGMGRWLDTNYLDDYVIDKVNEVSEELSFPITALAAHQNYVWDDYTYEIEKKLLKKAGRYHPVSNTVILSTFMEFSQRELHEKEVYQQLYERTAELCKIAEDAGINLAIEIEPNQLVHSLSCFLELAERVQSPALKINFDVGHFYLSERDLFASMEKAKDFICYSHIDNMCMGEHCHKLPWEGEIDLLAVYRKLKSLGYDGPVSLDIYIQDYASVALACLKYVNENVFNLL